MSTDMKYKRSGNTDKWSMDKYQESLAALGTSIFSVAGGGGSLPLQFFTPRAFTIIYFHEFCIPLSVRATTQRHNSIKRDPGG